MILILRVIQFPSDADGRICRYGNDRYFEWHPAGCHVARAGVFSIGAYPSPFDKFPEFDSVAHGHSFQGSIYDLLIDGLGILVIVKHDDRLAPVVFDPCALNFSQDLVPVMVVKQHADLVQS